MMKSIKYAALAAAFGACLSSAPAQAAAPWFVCGNLSQFTVMNGGVIPSYPVTQYEYGIRYNSQEPLPVVVTTWNVGIRIYNKQPYMVESDSVAAGQKYGGFIFYDGTSTPDDNCPNGMLRQRYWYTASDNGIGLGGSNGCYGSTMQVFCRLR